MKLKDKIQNQLVAGFKLSEVYSNLNKEGFEKTEIDAALNEISTDRSNATQVRNKKIAMVFAIVLSMIILFCIDEHHNNIKGNNLFKNAKFTLGYFTGEIITRKDMTKDGPWYLCKYKVNGEDYSAYKSCNLCKKTGENIFQKKYTIAYDSTDPGNSRILIFAAEFKDFNINQDSIMESIKFF